MHSHFITDIVCLKHNEKRNVTSLIHIPLNETNFLIMLKSVKFDGGTAYTFTLD